VDPEHLEYLLRETRREIHDRRRQIEAVAQTLPARELPPALDTYRVIIAAR